MSFSGPQSIRGKVTLATAIVTAIAMLAVVGITAYATQWVLKNTIATSLSERLDRAQEAVEAGDYELALDVSGNELLQIIDANGNVLASTSKKNNLAPLTGIEHDGDEFELDDLEFEVDDDDNDEQKTPAMAAAANAASGGSAASGATTASGGASAAGSQASAAKNSGSGSGSGSAGSTSGASGSASAAASDDDDDDDDDDGDDGDGDDADDSNSAQPVPAPAQTQQPAQVATDDSDDSYDDDYDDDDYDDDKAQSAPVQAASAAQADSDDSDDSDDGSDDYDDDEVDNGSANAQAYNDEDDDDEDVEGDDQPERANAPAPASFVQVAWAAGASSSNLSSGASSSSASAAPSSSALSSASASGAYVDASDVLGDAGPYLVMKRGVTSPDGPVTLAAVTSLAPAVRAGQVTAQLLLAVMMLVLLLVVFFTWRMTARTLRPVEEMRATAESINASDLSARIPVPKGDEDLSRLANTFNDMLARVEASFNDQKRFISDASHELKSPVAATGVMLETLQTHPESVDTQQVLDDLESQNQRMGSIVGDLLHLARSDEGRMTVNKKPIDLMDLLFEEVQTLRSHANVEIDTTDINPVVCEADPDRMSHVVRNLMENAARYAKSKVKVSCTELDGEVLILVSDDGPGIPEEDRTRVFDRFVRLDENRSQQQGGTGLGLAVVRSMVEAHGGTVGFGEPELGGATAVVSIPA